MTTEQIELNFVKRTETPASVSLRHGRRRNRAQWWFLQMRLAVDRAVDWKPSPKARPEQIYMPLSNNQIA